MVCFKILNFFLTKLLNFQLKRVFKLLTISLIEVKTEKILGEKNFPGEPCKTQLGLKDRITRKYSKHPGNVASRKKIVQVTALILKSC